MISPNVAITAAHCVSSLNNLEEDVEIEGHKYSIVDIVVPECWELNNEELRGYDIALLALDRDIKDPKRGSNWVKLYDPTKER